jgi:glutathione peroxidase
MKQKANYLLQRLRAVRYQPLLVGFFLSSTNIGLTSFAATSADANGTTGNSTPGVQASACPKVLQHTVLRLQDEKPQALCQYTGQVVVVVNTASYCGFTSQYKGLEALSAKYKDKGLVVLGFPSNDFSQEPDSNGKIADFCENTFGVKFPMFAKASVKGPDALPLFKQLAERTGTAPRWNFYKYIISRDGQTIKSYSAMTGPQDKSFVQEIEKQLATKGSGA